jgi:hypothetical protein
MIGERQRQMNNFLTKPMYAPLRHSRYVDQLLIIPVTQATQPAPVEVKDSNDLSLSPDIFSHQQDTGFVRVKAFGPTICVT